MALNATQLAALLAPAQRTHVEAWLTPLNYAMQEGRISEGENRAAFFLAQMLHESGGLVYWHEIWGPTKQQEGYEGRKDLGNVHPGDGFKFRGRGPIQITGRTNYAECGKALSVDLLAHPELLETPAYGFRSAAWFWTTRGLNAIADQGDFVEVTHRINGGATGLADRKARLATVRKVLGLSI